MLIQFLKLMMTVFDTFYRLTKFLKAGNLKDSWREVGILIFELAIKLFGWTFLFLLLGFSACVRYAAFSQVRQHRRPRLPLHVCITFKCFFGMQYTYN